MEKSLTEVSVEVIRGQGKDTDVTVYYEARDLTERVTTKPGVETYQAIAGEDYQKPSTVTIKFAKGEVGVLFVSKITVSEQPSSPS